MQLNDSLFETTSTEGVLNLLFGIDDNDRDNGKYRNMLLKYKYWDRWDPGPPSNWSQKAFTIEVEDLVISGNDLVCYSPNRTYTVSGYPGGSTFNWTKSANLTQVGGSTSSTYTVHAYSSSTSGQGNVQVTVTDDNCNWPKTKVVWVGKPGVPTTLPPGYPTYEMGLYEILSIHVTSAPGASSNIYQWWTSGSSIEQLTPTWHNFMTVEAVALDTSNFYVKSQNGCGLSATGGGTIRVIYGGGPLGLFSISPNPTDSYFTIDINEEKINAEGLSLERGCILTMVDKTGMVIYKAEFIEFPYIINTSKLPDGLYIINLISDGKISSIQVIIEH